ncbi:MAG: hypothetical protein ABIQ07_03755 [Ginsengibacter sp.]
MAIKSLTTPMVQLLKDCHTSEINTVSHIKLYDQSAVEGLIERGLMKQTNILKEGKPETICTVTDLGKLYLKHYFKM